VQRDGEAVRLSFAEEYDKVPMGRSRASVGDWALGANVHSCRPRDTYKLKILAQRKAARKAQVERAIAAVTRLLATLEHDIKSGSGDAGIRSWIDLVRSELVNPVNSLTTEIRTEAGGVELPLWWLGANPISAVRNVGSSPEGD
jgi:hypothetical protein